MTVSLILGIFWVLAATATAFLPMRLQYKPGLTLLIAAPVVIVWLGVDFGLLIGVLAAAGFVSMFRNPLRYLYARAKGERPEIPK